MQKYKENYKRWKGRNPSTYKESTRGRGGKASLRKPVLNWEAQDGYNWGRGWGRPTQDTRAMGWGRQEGQGPQDMVRGLGTPAPGLLPWCQGISLIFPWRMVAWSCVYCARSSDGVYSFFLYKSFSCEDIGESNISWDTHSAIFVNLIGNVLAYFPGHILRITLSFFPPPHIVEHCRRRPCSSVKEIRHCVK